LGIQIVELEQDVKIRNKNSLKSWIKKSIKSYNRITGNINIIIVSDNYLLHLNKTYLKKDCLTDIITFNFNNKNIISGDLFISLDRVKDNAADFGVSYSIELLRVIIHGILHLVGYDDKDKDQENEIRNEEDKALQYVRDLIIINQ